MFHNHVMMCWLIQTEELSGWNVNLFMCSELPAPTPPRETTVESFNWAAPQPYLNQQQQTAARLPVRLCFHQLFDSVCWLESSVPECARPWISTLLANAIQSHLWAYWFMVRAIQEQDNVCVCVCACWRCWTGMVCCMCVRNLIIIIMLYYTLCSLFSDYKMLDPVPKQPNCIVNYVSREIFCRRLRFTNLFVMPV